MNREFIHHILTEQLKDIRGFGGFPFFALSLLVAFFVKESLFIALAIAFVLSYIVTSTIRYFHFKQRPNKQAYHGLIEKIDASSFPSLHAMRASILACIFLFYFENIFISLALVVLALLVGLSRVKDAYHDKQDVFAGLVLGVLVAIVSLYFA